MTKQPLIEVIIFVRGFACVHSCWSIFEAVVVTIASRVFEHIKCTKRKEVVLLASVSLSFGFGHCPETDILFVFTI